MDSRVRTPGSAQGLPGTAGSLRENPLTSSIKREETPITPLQKAPPIKQIFFEEVKPAPAVHAVAPNQNGLNNNGAISWSQEIRRRATVALSR
jgi:hypothetical protein